MTMNTFTKGERVKFRRTHDKATQLVGTITKINADGTAEIETEVDGRLVEVSGIEVADIKDLHRHPATADQAKIAEQSGATTGETAAPAKPKSRPHRKPKANGTAGAQGTATTAE
jgi:hypothetical protein